MKRRTALSTVAALRFQPPPGGGTPLLTELLHPGVPASLAGAGHGARILLADGRTARNGLNPRRTRLRHPRRAGRQRPRVHRRVPVAQKDVDWDAVFPAGVRARAMAEVFEALGTPLPAVATAFLYTHPSIIEVTLGMRTLEQVVRIVELHDQRVPDSLLDDLRAQGLISSDVLAGHAGGKDARCL